MGCIDRVFVLPGVSEYSTNELDVFAPNNNSVQFIWMAINFGTIITAVETVAAMNIPNDRKTKNVVTDGLPNTLKKYVKLPTTAMLYMATAKYFASLISSGTSHV